MIPRPFFAIPGAALLAALAACNGVAAVPPLSPSAQQVRVENSDPPVGASSVGALYVTDGQGCSFTGDRGTLEGATARLKEAAVQQGANYVKLTKVTEPYAGHDCNHREFKLEGIGYRLAGTPIIVRSSAVPAAPAAPVASFAPPSPVALAAPAALASDALCSPTCSPGYACEAGVCRPLCNPACSAAQVCRADRVCVPAGSTP